ncbi:response regulator of citrate/malate metabolism [Desulfosporosinus orientis DSM 765]|uniref:Stage 0 sporulation protein A homolog n=1 Tax=Desulfosporosinus orientis (strain ATCC 19365 / DSM 765 / NCIMB 8382 / VKM B-1628 / Singapore I) TaxID=768706 RepID=G7WEJ4_DESOD|nr:response regulator [Desulfosporosinus orientis]AET70807.1 response regulator of citrate/malate metabolism [Desulfosporosinus orientis DSM 765]
MRIIIMDDDQALRYTLSEIFTFAGWEPIAYPNGREGVQGFLSHGADIILVDYHMPEMDGLETVRFIRKQDPHIPILVLTVDERQKIADRFLDAGATDFALKPVKAPDLIARVQLHMRLLDMTKVVQAAPKLQEEVFVTKGISKATLSYIEGFLSDCHKPATVEEIAKELSLAVPTVYRYLTYLVQNGKVQSIPSYQKIGRPKNRYCWI